MPGDGKQLTIDEISNNPWQPIRSDNLPGEGGNPFRQASDADQRAKVLARHKLWMESIQHEYPSPYEHFRIGIYIRYYNQTKYSNYLDYHKQDYTDTIKRCPNWSLVDFYVDEGQTAPFMEHATGWTRLLTDCMQGKVNLIVMQKISDVSRNSDEIAFCTRMLANLKPPIGPIGVYFINEDLYTLASYYQSDMHEVSFLPGDGWVALQENAEESYVDSWEEKNVETID